MTKNSTTEICQINSESEPMSVPRKSTISFIRQFARAYTVLAGAGVGLNHLIVN